MKNKLIVSGIAASLVAGAFFAGLAVGKGAADKFKVTPVEDLKDTRRHRISQTRSSAMA